MPKRAATALFAVAVLVALAAGPATAAKRGAGTSGGPVLYGPAIAHLGETYTITGSGFAPGSLVPLEIGEANGCCIALNQVADAEGGFSYTGEVWAAGTYSVRALAPRNGGRWRVAASYSFQAYP